MLPYVDSGGAKLPQNTFQESKEWISSNCSFNNDKNDFQRTQMNWGGTLIKSQQLLFLKENLAPIQSDTHQWQIHVTESKTPNTTFNKLNNVRDQVWTQQTVAVNAAELSRRQLASTRWLYQWITVNQQIK